ncbi:AAA family ATPase [Limosilactobacillus reuteri]|uniref:UvrD-helicase domain-containing protein n=1 Tax=Limosilactobacillus reuteri TaxID=1598 RepID=UPI001E396D07|nr:UvrD-helicase domain-containing protein [Limosilactobacillus reuteri]MCC4383179.1 AAA family ATPase [Limosilactobacillus reuteri]MCC4420016.1 AAA family ATPase [Limosilactobacillus reuteri]
MLYNLPRLIGEQCRILYLPEDRNQVVLGVAGSGKSVEAVYRAIWISLGHPEDKIILLTVNSQINEQLKLMVDSFKHSPNIEVSTVYSYFKKIINQYYPKESKVRKSWHDFQEKKRKQIDPLLKAATESEEKKVFNDLIENSQKKYDDSTIWNKNNVNDFIKDEINWMQRNNICNRQQYLTITRIGRGNQQLSSQQRNTMFDIYLDFYNLRLNETGKAFDFADIYHLIDKCSIPEDAKPKYVIIDEVQDISPVMFHALRQIIRPDGLWTVFGDMSQNIFGERISWSSLGLTNIRKQYHLHRNYRNTREIGELAKSIIDNAEFRDLGQQEEVIEPSLSAIKGPQPIIWHHTANEDYLIDQLKKQLNNGSVAIILMNKNQGRDIKQLLKDNQIDFVSNINKLEGHVVFVGSINRIKGLEFDSVFVVNIDDYQQGMDRVCQGGNGILIDDKLEIEDRLKLARTIYVAITRAHRYLFLAYRQSKLPFLFNDPSLMQLKG